MTATKIRQSELMTRHKLKPGEIVAFRDSQLTRDVDWWKEGTVIYWTEDAAQKLENRETTKTVPVETPQPETETIELRIIKPCNNPRFVIGDLNGFKVYVQCHPKQSARIVKKTVKVQVTRNGEETTYQYLP